MDDDSSCSVWSYKETRTFLDLYKKYSPLYKCGHQKETIFALVSSKLSEKNIFKTRVECRVKHNSLIRTYKVINKRPNYSSSKFRFYHDIKELLEGDSNEPIDKEIEEEMEEFEKKFNKQKKKSEKTSSAGQIYYKWDPEETRMLIELYGQQKEILPNGSVDWVRILIDLQNNGHCLETTDEDCRRQLHKNLKEYLKINIPNSEDGQNEFEFYQEFENIMENLEEIHTDLSDDEDSEESIIWSTKETFKLIELYKNHYQEFKSNNKNCWTFIAECLTECGFEEKSPEKVRRKFENLRRTYRSCISHGRENYSRFPFLDALREIFEDSEFIWIDEKFPGGSETSDKKTWSHSETSDLIATMKDFVTDQSVLPTSWPTVSEFLLKRGVKREASDCEKKWTTLLRTYKPCLLKYKRTNTLPKRSPYFNEMHQLLSDSNKPKKSDDGATNNAEDEESNSGPWTDAEIKELIVVCKEFDEVKGEDIGRIRWQKISNCLRKKGIHKTVEECSRRWTHLFRKYRFCLLDKLFNENKETKFKYFNEIYKHFGDDSLLEYYSKKVEKSLTPDKIGELIRLKHKYSKINKSYTITDEQWNTIAKTLEFPLRVSILRTFYFVMFQKYKQLKKDLKFGDEINWQYYEIFDGLYGMKLDLVAGETAEERVTMPMEPEPESEPSIVIELIAESSSELDKKLKFIANNFSQICKFCLNTCDPSTSLIELQDNPELNMKVDELFFQKKKRKKIENNSDKICSKCAEKVELSYEFRNTVDESMSLLKQFSEKVVIAEVPIVSCAKQEQDEIRIIQTDPLETESQSQDQDILSFDFDEIIEKEEVEMEEVEVEEVQLEEEDKNLLEKVTDTKNEEEYLMPKRSGYKTCEICGKLVSSLETHKFTHTDRSNKPFKCTFKGCNMSFPFNPRLQKHLKTHYQIRNYVCNVCGQSFVTGDSLIKHRVTHDKILKYVCKVCGRKFYRQSTYKKHLTTHGIGFNHFCPICKKGFLWEGIMKQHMNVHGDNRPFTCKYCPKAFSTARCLRHHVKSKHPEDKLVNNPINQHAQKQKSTPATVNSND